MDIDVIDVIAAKRDKRPLTNEQIDWVIDAYTKGVVADYQMAALAMAIYLNGMNREETACWTMAMVDSGETMDFSVLGRPVAHKHSSGGVGDKISLPLAPVLGVFDVVVPKLSGRGLGHTGGTLDKLESIPGWRGLLSNEELMAQLKEIGIVIAGAGADIAPADKKLYALRDTTGTVASMPLIASSIMSKKISEGPGALVLDVKVGNGAFMANVEDAQELSRIMVDLGTDAGVDTVALLTNMSTPLGRTAGNALEVREAVEVLAGDGPADVVELTLTIARELLQMLGQPDADPEAALADGRAMDLWRKMIRAQDGDPDAPLPVAKETTTINAETSGWVSRLDALPVGVAAWRLGAGRARKEDSIQPGAGVEMHAKPGDRVLAGQPLFTLHTDIPEKFDHAAEALIGAVEIVAEQPDTTPLVLGRVD